MKKNILVDIICIGDELLIGQTINTNAAWIGAEVNKWGMKVRRAISIADDAHQIKEEIDESLSQSTITFITGGLGPTKDDITKKTFCDFFEDVLVEDKATTMRVTEFFESRNLPMLEVNYLQAMVPSQCQVIPNYHGTAPGMWMEKEGHIVISMPGVPYEMQNMMTTTLLPKIAKEFDLPEIIHYTLMTVGVGESYIAEQLSHLEEEIKQQGISLAYLPSPGLVKLRLSSYGHETGTDHNTVIKQFASKIESILGSIVFAHEDTSLIAVVSQLMKQNQHTLSVAESCTGGTIQSWITSLEGASDYFKGGITPYLSKFKTSVLQIPEELLSIHPVVSEPVAQAMAKASQQLFESDYALATTGYAGPGNEDSEIPVGTVCIALATPHEVISKTLRLGKNRERNIRITSLHALNMLRLSILNK